MITVTFALILFILLHLFCNCFFLKRRRESLCFHCIINALWSVAYFKGEHIAGNAKRIRGSDLKQILVNFDIDIFFTYEIAFYYSFLFRTSYFTYIFWSKGEFTLSIV